MTNCRRVDSTMLWLSKFGRRGEYQWPKHNAARPQFGNVEARQWLYFMCAVLLSRLRHESFEGGCSLSISIF